MTYGSKKGRADLKHGGADLVGPTYQETFSGASSSLPIGLEKSCFRSLTRHFVHIDRRYLWPRAHVLWFQISGRPCPKLLNISMQASLSEISICAKFRIKLRHYDLSKPRIPDWDLMSLVSYGRAPTAVDTSNTIKIDCSFTFPLQ
jgi:hypothetical protein